MDLQWGVIPYLFLLLLSYSYSTGGRLLDNHTASVSSSWRNNPLSLRTILYKDGSMVNVIIDPPSDNPHFALGFYSAGNSSSFLLAIFLHYPESDSGFPQVIWSPNRNNPVKRNATLEFSQDGDLVLQDVNGNFVWSSNTSRRSIVRLELTDTGNLMLFNSSNTAIWQSFDQPTDTLVLGQKLVDGQKLIASVSPWVSSNGVYSLFVSSYGLYVIIESYGHQNYYYSKFLAGKLNNEPIYVRLQNGSLSLYICHPEPYKPDEDISFPPASLVQFMKLDSDGHLREYDWSCKWVAVADLLNISESAYSLLCGKYGVYSEGHCDCLQQASQGASLFQPINSTEQTLGCREVIPVTREDSKYHILLNLTHVYRFNIFPYTLDTDLTSCIKTCLRNCSCKAATFSSHPNQSNGFCSIHSDIFSFIHNENSNSGLVLFDWDHTTFIKVQTVASTRGKFHEPLSAALLAVILPSFGILFCILLIAKQFLHLRKMNVAEKHKKDVFKRHASHLDFLSGILMQFSYEDLKDATQNFSCKLGEGAFGSVYEGSLANGTKVAVKRLDALGGHAKMSFSAEVATIGSIHHVNLVKLVGFCSDESQYILVYEYLCNGSLDKWIFCPRKDVILDWKTRRKIITHIARGIAYLHDECSQKILHLDIKPQNILLDDKFNAMVSDFGLSKLIDKDQSKVMTAIRGTPGYMAPEWLTFTITEKVDVYSFGIVVMEILCGRKNVDCSAPEEIPLLNLLMKNTSEDGLYDMIDSTCDDMKLHATEVLGIMKLALWCVHSDCRRRPSMTVVVKVLDSLVDAEGNLNNKLLTTLPSPYRVGIVLCSPMLPSVLSGPR